MSSLSKGVAAADTVKLFMGVRIPFQMLRGPWTADKINLLRRISSWGASLKYSDQNVCYVCYEGLISAIIENNAEVFEYLLELQGSLDTEVFNLFELVVHRGPNPALVRVLFNHCLEFKCKHEFENPFSLSYQLSSREEMYELPRKEPDWKETREQRELVNYLVLDMILGKVKVLHRTSPDGIALVVTNSSQGTNL